jgi:hypothetical protein
MIGVAGAHRTEEVDVRYEASGYTLSIPSVGDVRFRPDCTKEHPG